MTTSTKTNERKQRTMSFEKKNSVSQIKTEEGKKGYCLLMESSMVMSPH